MRLDSRTKKPHRAAAEGDAADRHGRRRRDSGSCWGPALPIRAYAGPIPCAREAEGPRPMVHHPRAWG